MAVPFRDNNNCKCGHNSLANGYDLSFLAVFRSFRPQFWRECVRVDEKIASRHGPCKFFFLDKMKIDCKVIFIRYITRKQTEPLLKGNC